MKWSRRAVLGAGATLAVATPALAQPGGKPLRVRKDVRNLTVNDPDIQALMRAIPDMKARPAEDPLSWQRQVDIHAGSWRQHNTWRFMPWHRCQLHWFERIVAKVSGKADFAMPYWDWQGGDGRLSPIFFQAPFFDETRENDQEAVDRRGSDLASFNFVDNRAQLWGGQAADLFQDTFGVFMGRQWSGAGTVENSGHSYVHMMVGGNMGDVTTAVHDPLFFFHHCNIDRVWAAWQTRAETRRLPMSQKWLDEVFDNFVDETGGRAQGKKTSDVLHTNQLGYRYDADYPFRYFDERPPAPPPAKTHQVQLSAKPYKAEIDLDPGTRLPLRLPLPADLMQLLAADRTNRFKVSGEGRVSSADMAINGSVLTVTVERIKADGTTDNELIAAITPFVGDHGAPAAAPAMAGMPGMSAPASAAPPATAPAPATPPAAAAPATPSTAPSADAASGAEVHDHGFLFTTGPEIYDLSGKDGQVLEIAVVVSSRWLSHKNTAPPPSLSGIELDLTVTEFDWA